MQNIIIKKWKEIVLIAIIVADVFIFQSAYSVNGDFLKIIFLDVGQGDSALIITPSGRKFLIDGGENKTAERRISEILPFYDSSLHAVFMTHTDKDHLGGLFDILQNMQVTNVFNSGLFDAEETRLGLQDVFSLSEEVSLREGDSIVLDTRVHLEVLWPPRMIADNSLKDPNDFSLVLRLVYGENSALFMGDAPKSVENYLISKYGAQIDADVLKVGHHGSKTSTSEMFLSAVSPQFSIISAGESNSYGHPHAEVMQLLENFKSEILETSKLGNISLCLDGKSANKCE